MDDRGIRPASPRLLVAAEQLLSRAGLSALLEERGCLVLAATDGADLQRDIDRFQPDLLVVDMGWTSGAMLDRLLQTESELPVLALAENDSLGPLLTALGGFSRFGLLPRESDADSIAAALAAMESGLTVLEPRLSSFLRASDEGALSPSLNALTARENEVLALLARGLTNRAIALELGITRHTVKYHVKAILGKLDAQSRTEAVVKATQLGWLTL